MYDEPEERSDESAGDPSQRALEKCEELRIHAQLAAVFEAVRKFDAQLRNLSADIARQVQQAMGRLEKAKAPQSPVLPDSSKPAAFDLLKLVDTLDLASNDYHVHRRPGEVMIVRWLVDEQVATFYERLQAHFDAGLEGHKDDERSATQWKQDDQASAYLAALDNIKESMADRYLRRPIEELGLVVLSTVATDEMNIVYLSDYLMSVDLTDLVAPASAPPLDPSDSDLAWFFKLFCLRASVDGQPRMCFFTYLQKSDDF